MTDQELVEKAFTMLEKAYVPYSRFPVGAALEGADGAVYTGCNVENSAFGSRSAARTISGTPCARMSTRAPAGISSIVSAM